MEITTGSAFWFVLSACIGGVFVLVGILMEVLAEKASFKNTKSQRRWALIKVSGEWILIFGIVVEVVVAGLSAKAEWQTRQLAIKNDPINQQIRSINVQLYLVLNDTNLFNNKDSWSEVATFGGWIELLDKHGGVAAKPACDEYDDTSWSFSPLDVRNRQVISMSFNWPAVNKLVNGIDWLSRKNMSVRELNETIIGARLKTPGCGAHFSIFTGQGGITINNSIHRQFLIPKFSDDVFSFSTNTTYFRE